jgi:TPR repeat protein
MDIHTPWLGIDFGTCRTSASVLLNGQPCSVPMLSDADYEARDMLSAVFIDEDGRILVGQEAFNARRRDPARYLENFKRDLASRGGFAVNVAGERRIYLWEELVGAVLHRIRQAAERYLQTQSLQRVILSVPALYIEDGPEWRVMQNAAHRAGFSTVHLVPEPHAAAIYYDHVLQAEGSHSQADALTLVYDLGGGTFDTALISRGAGGYELLDVSPETSGIAYGGRLFDEKIAEDFARKCPITWEQCAPTRQSATGDIRQARQLAKDQAELQRFLIRAKHSFALGEVSEFNELDPLLAEERYVLTRKQLNGMIGPLIDRTIECCRRMVDQSGVAWSAISRVLMVGGSCRIPLVRDKLDSLLREVGSTAEICMNLVGKTRQSVDPVLAVALGASLSLSPTAMEEMGDDYLKGHGVNQDPSIAVRWYRQAAERGEANAQYKLGQCYLEGLGIELDPGHAMLWLQRAASQSHIEACYEASVLLLEGDRLPRAPEQAVEWLKRAAELNHAPSQFRLSGCYADGIGISQDYGKACGWCQRSAKNGFPEAQWVFGNICWAINDPGYSREEAERWYRNAADQDHPKAQESLGDIYWAKGDYTKAAHWFDAAANHGLTGARYSLGLCYLEGKGVDVNVPRALEHIGMAAEQGFALAQYRLGIEYLESAIPDYGQSLQWLQRAAAQGVTRADGVLGQLYLQGRGVIKNPAMAMQHFRKAADGGLADGQFWLGVCYMKGHGVAYSPTEAKAWFEKAAASEHTEAAHGLGELYEFGLGVNQDWGESCRWYIVSLLGGREDSAQDLFELVMLRELRNQLAMIPSTYLRTSFPPQKLAAVREIYGEFLDASEHILMIYDDTLLGGAKEGAIVTTYGIGCKRLAKPVRYWKFAQFDDEALAEVMASYVSQQNERPRVRTGFAAIASGAMSTYRTEVRSMIEMVRARLAGDSPQPD